MDTLIYFMGDTGDGALTLRVSEDVEAVNEKLTAGHGAPVALTGVGRNDGRPVYVAPAAIAFWRQAPDRQIRTV